ncbi:hypothetical protein HHK36_001523 [Tetracentron sinense]|uniref:Uncharacterized protein n=1 Tax=Tetracentron sinense TaxID=13715 RepID=A0A834ZW75_TETSI|nr:hypothetical protein HHK36_001523 [Tetracentron sinense]
MEEPADGISVDGGSSSRPPDPKASYAQVLGNRSRSTLHGGSHGPIRMDPILASKKLSIPVGGASLSPWCEASEVAGDLSEGVVSSNPVDLVLSGGDMVVGDLLGDALEVQMEGSHESLVVEGCEELAAKPGDAFVVEFRSQVAFPSAEAVAGEGGQHSPIPELASPNPVSEVSSSPILAPSSFFIPCIGDVISPVRETAVGGCIKRAIGLEPGHAGPSRRGEGEGSISQIDYSFQGLSILISSKSFSWASLTEMASLSATWLYQDRGLRGFVSADGLGVGKSPFLRLQTSFVGSFTSGKVQVNVGLNNNPFERRVSLLPCVKCAKKDGSFDPLSVERPPYYSYMDSTSGQLEPASGARASIPGQEYWPEGTASRVKAAKAPEPTGKSSGAPSNGKNPGSRRKKFKTSVAAPESSILSVDSSDPETLETSDDILEEAKNLSTEYVVYQSEPDEESISAYELDKKHGHPHPFIDPQVKKPIEEPLTSEELWWNWRKPDKEQWSRWQRRRPDVETVFVKAMAETGQIKLYGDDPTLTETSLYRARRHLFKEERSLDLHGNLAMTVAVFLVLN